MNKLELYDWYVENCTKNEIPLSFKEWEREIYPQEKERMDRFAGGMFSKGGLDLSKKNLKEIIFYDLEALKDKQSQDWEYHFNLLKGNLKDLFKT